MIKIDKRSFETHIVIPNELVEKFRILMDRALNTHCDAHPAFKELGDMLSHGHVLQDYYKQRSDKPLNIHNPENDIRSIDSILPN